VIEEAHHVFVHKRLSFSHESELRAVLQRAPTKEKEFDFEATHPMRVFGNLSTSMSL